MAHRADATPQPLARMRELPPAQRAGAERERLVCAPPPPSALRAARTVTP